MSWVVTQYRPLKYGVWATPGRMVTGLMIPLYQTRHLIRKNDSFYICVPIRWLRCLGYKKGDDVLLWKGDDQELHLRFVKGDQEKLGSSVSVGRSKESTEHLP